MKIMYKTVLLIMAFESFCKTQAARKKPFMVKLNRVSCPKFSDRIKYMECNWKKVATSKYNLGSIFMLNNDLDRDAEIQLKIHISRSGGKWLKFVDLKVNLCDALQKLLSIPLANTLLNEALQTSNVPCSCPIKGNVMYNMSNFMVSDKLFPPYTPTNLEFNCTTNYFEHQKVIYTFIVEGGIIPSA
ncbi:uncharacterized protein LOC131994832 [Stomoxys calcitrans]|uniref:uncharacterized protein LOC131994832 n=1 Tax=Stomoxys calcitrans TaxID=35570 RepID=UPI0027E327B0|nr:uncharacterized protein LOC131994832 [Stomoxys calcitrans]